MTVTISPSLIGDAARGRLSVLFQNVGSAASKTVSANGSVSAAVDHVAISAGARLATQSVSQRQGIANAAKAAALLQVAQKSMEEIDARLTRMKQLAADASQTALSNNNPAPNLVSDRDRAVMNIEFTSLRAEIDTIAAGTKFDGIAVFGGATVTVTEQQQVTVTNTDFTAANVGSSISLSKGFDALNFATNAANVSDGDVFSIQYSKGSGLFTVTNETTGQSATAAGPASSPGPGQTVDVEVSAFGLTIQLNENFDTNKNINGNPTNRQFTVAATVTETTTTVDVEVTEQQPGQLTIALGGIGGNGITINLNAVSSGDLAAGLDTADISTEAGASAALANLDAAIAAFGVVSTDVQSIRGRLGFASSSLAFGASVADAERASRLTPEVAIDISLLAATGILDDQGISQAAQDASAARALLASLFPTNTVDDAKTVQTDSPNLSGAVRNNVSGLLAALPASSSSDSLGQFVSVTV